MAPLVFWAAAVPAPTRARITTSIPNLAIRGIDPSKK
jgi:hypothetical protein